MKRLLFLLLLGAIGAFFVRGFLIEGIYLASDSMAPTLNTNDHVLVNKAAYLFKSPQHGEIVLLKVPQIPDKELVKRVIAVGGDQIEIRRKTVYLNGKKLDESYARFDKPDVMFKGDNIDALQIPKGYVFVMGDNRDFSGDSRDWKAASGDWSPYVPVRAVKGKIILNK